MMTLFVVTSGLVASVLLGRGAVRLVSTTSETGKLPAAEVWGLSIVLGVGLTGWLSFLWAWLGGALGFAFSVTLAVAGAVSGLWVIWHASVPPTVENSRLVRTCQWLIGLLVVLAFLQTVLTPQRFWDERAIFAIKAAVLWEDASISSPALLNPEFVQYHPRYPLLLPLVEQHTYALLGRVDDRWSKLWFPLLYAGLVLTWTGVCSRHFGRAWGWMCGLLLATVPVLMPDEYGFLSAQADAPMACFHGIAVLYLWDAMSLASSSARSSRLLLAGFAASCAAFTKDEGIAFLMIDVLSWCMAMVLGRQPIAPSTTETSIWRQLDAFALMLFVAIIGLMLAPWFIHRRLLPQTTEMHYFDRMSWAMLYERLDTLRWSVPHLVRRMFFEWRLWGLQWWAGLAGITLRPRRSVETPQLFLIFNLLGALAALLVAGMLAPAELEEHLGGSTHRYLMQLVPVVMLLMAAQWSNSAEIGHSSES